MNLGEKIKKIRNGKSFSLRDLAGKVDLSASFLSQIEQGKASPSIENLKKIANCLDVRVSYLIEDEEVKKDAPQPEGPHARRWPAGRLHPPHRPHRPAATQAAGGQPDAPVLA